MSQSYTAVPLIVKTSKKRIPLHQTQTQLQHRSVSQARLRSTGYHVCKWKHCQLCGSMRRNLQVTCTFLFEAQCFSSAQDPGGYQWPFSALLTARLYSFPHPSTSTFSVMISNKMFAHTEICHYNHLVAQLSLFLLQLCQTQSQLSAALQLLLPQHLSVLGCVRLCALLLDLWKTRTISGRKWMNEWIKMPVPGIRQAKKKMRSITPDAQTIVKLRLSWAICK